ncbi:MAG: VOC family protein [Microbacterium sp.]|uniref:VOC family protein n=1 Tax=Microbacterium sp. TaxID=51671 RepID=UPI0039E506C9
MVAGNKRDAHSIHHVNFPITDPEKTYEWYHDVLGMERFVPSRRSGGANEPTRMALLMTHGERGDFDLHFSPVDHVDPKQHYHFAIEVEDFDEFLVKLTELGVPFDEPYRRPQNNSATTTIRDPDGHHVEIVWHGDREW